MACICVSFGSVGEADNIIAFRSDFDGVLSFAPRVSGAWSGVTTLESVRGYAGIGTGTNTFEGNFLRNASGIWQPEGGPLKTTLTLTGLPSHESIDLNFLLAIIDSWNSPGQDFVVAVDGIPVFDQEFDNIRVGTDQSYIPPPGVQLLAWTFPQLGWGGPDNGADSTRHTDSAWNMSFEPTLHGIQHNSSSLQVDFYASIGAGGLHESWGMDNLEVVLNYRNVEAVPEPSSLVAFASLSLTGIGIAAWKRRLSLAQHERQVI
jgi:hypothetical protein